MRLYEKVTAARDLALEGASANWSAKLALDELTLYLLSPKFHLDPTVQVQDVLNRLDAIKSALLDADSATMRTAATLRPSLAA